jgi:hypothetical protein
MLEKERKNERTKKKRKHPATVYARKRDADDTHMP